jgi:hypothetical protein
MREATAALWCDLLAAHARIHVYTVDPGAHAMACELVPLLRKVGRLGEWFAEGWSSTRKPGCRPAADLFDAMTASDALLLGSQMNCARTQAILRQAADSGVTTIFVFDHWKNYGEHFGSGRLADRIVVPDDVARSSLLAAVGADAAPRIRVLPHLAIEAAVDRVRACNLAPRPGTIAMLLDPTEADNGLGYDWQSALAAAVDKASMQAGSHLLVKPHPRQDASVVARELAVPQRRGARAELYHGDMEPLIATADEVWGMTTIALHVALAAGKPIRSFQIGRTPAGARASNPHIEPYAIV